MKHALEDYKVVGLPTNITFSGKLCSHPAFIAGEVETGFIPKYKDELLPPIQPVSPTGLALSALAIVLQEHNVQSTKYYRSADPYSPFTSTSGKRFNHLLERTIPFKDQDKDINVEISYGEDGAYTVKIPGVSEPITAKGKLEDSKLTAFIGDRLVNATVVVDESNLTLFYDGNSYSLKIPVKDYSGGEVTKGSLLSPMPGRILEVLAQLKQKVKKGDQLGMFHFGGSTYCLMFGPEVNLEFDLRGEKPGLYTKNIPVNAKIAVVKSQ